MLINWIRDCDFFGMNVTLYYKGEKRHKTFIGGCCTFLICTLLLAYFAVIIVNLCTSASYTSILYETYNNINLTQNEFNLTTTQ